MALLLREPNFGGTCPWPTIMMCRKQKRQIRLQFPPPLCNQISQEEVIFEKGRYASRQQNEDFELFEPLQFLLIDLLREM